MIAPAKAYANTPKGQIHYMTSGKGAPVLLLHQTPRSSDEFLEVLPLLSKNFRAIAMDTIGFGNSYKPKKVITIEDCARGVIDFLDTMNIRQTHLVGHHTGAVIAIEVAVSHPSRVKRLVLSGCPFVDEEVRKKNRPLMDADEEKVDGSHLLSLWRRRKSFYPEDRPDLLRRFMIDALLAGENRINGHAMVHEYRLEDKYARISQPTLLISGTKDRWSYPVMSKISKLIKNSQTFVIEGGTVPLPDHMPKEYALAVSSFLSKRLSP
ncbi:MAG: alpha/beta hydrolase [Nitrososphaerota archaeon]|nr:alpha/beta hydrolase [Nitrososphaerota archaeon]